MKPSLPHSELQNGLLHIKPPATPVGVGDYFTVWVEEVTVAVNLFNRLVSFWIQK